MKMLLQTFISVVFLGVGVITIGVNSLDSNRNTKLYGSGTKVVKCTNCMYNTNTMIVTRVCQDPADIGFLVDASGSVGSTEFDQAKTFLINIIKKFGIANQAVKISAFAFDDKVQGGFYFKNFSTEQDISTAIQNIVYTGGLTNFDIPLTFAREHMFVAQSGARGYTKKILIFITDGDATTTNRPGQLLRDMGVAVYAIGVGSNVNTNNLDKIATSVTHRYEVLSFSLINDIKQALISQACEEIGEHAKDHPCKTNKSLCNFGICRITGTTSYRCDCNFGYTGNHCEIDINECEGVTCLNQGTCVDHVGYFTCNCRQFFEGTYCETNMCEPSAADIVFVIDVSASMDSKLLNHAKDHAELTTKEWQIDTDHFQIALVTVAESANTVLSFSSIATKDDFRNGITNLNLKNEPSNVHLALYKAVDLLINKGRPNVKKRIILYSDGLPSNPSALEQTLSHSQYYSNIEIYTVAIGIDVSHYFLSRISRDMSNVFPYNTDALWHHIMQDLIKPECNACIESEQADVIVLVDLAGIQQDYLNSIVPTSLVKILSKISLGTDAVKLALVTYCDQASTRFSFDAYLENNRVDLQRSLSSYEGITDKSSNISEAIRLSEALLGDLTEGARSSAKKVVLVISEFKTSLNEQDLRYAEVLRNSGINMHTIGIFTDGSAFDAMSGLASTSYHIGTNGNIYVDQIDTYIESFVQELKSLHCTLII